MYDFDKVVDRKSTNAYKWKSMESQYGCGSLYPMWVADMEFEAAPAISRRLAARIDERVFGYELLSPKYYEAVIHWLKTRHNYETIRECIAYCPNVMSGLSGVLQALTQAGDEILLNTPVYGHFFSTITGCGRKVLGSKLTNTADRATFDFDDMERRVSSRTKVLLLCNPHNPTGRVWSLGELQKVVDFCEAHHLLLISDEIHFDLIFDGPHTMAAAVARETAVKTVSLISPTKSFNVAGVQVANILSDDTALVDAAARKLKELSYPMEHAFAEAVTLGAYLESADWLDELLIYLKENRDRFIDFVRSELPVLTATCPEATYLLWVDCHRLGLGSNELKRFWTQKCGLALSDGQDFGNGGEQYQRFNIACSRIQMMKALHQIRDVFNQENML